MTPTARHRQHKPIQSRRWPILSWLKKLFWLSLFAALIAWTASVVWLSRQRIQLLPSSSTHAFIITKNTDPTILLLSQAKTSATLASLQVWRPNQSNRHPVAINLPANLADTQTTAGQYARSGYNQELEQLVEQTLAVPLTDVVILPDTLAGTTPLSVQWIKQRASLIKLTIGLPWTLRDLPVIRSSLSATDLWRLAWYVRGLHAPDLAPVSLPDQALISQSDQVQVNTSLSDQFVAKHFAIPEIKDRHTSIVIKNATTTSGIASLVGRFVTNMGGEVVAVEPADQQNANQSALTSQQSSALTDRLSAFLGIPFRAQPRTGRERADVELILGSDILSRLGQ